ncbi:MAG: proline--tRNA ligase [bacterium]|nr:proline--tRNA ligase [bacterium]MDT8396307.1 proline--tRNA ligase [bacterium]
MRYSRYFLPTLREVPADAEVVSHQLMLRAGMVRRIAAGIYDILPLGLRVIRKVERIIREEMDRAGAHELFMPSILPAELWQETGRWDFYGKELLRIRDRNGRDFCYGPTHEEIFTDLVRREIRSYRQLPRNLYQIQTKFRDEVRPRFGLMRGREFSMKDAYSFDRDKAGAEKSYQAMHEAYTAIFRRCGLKFRDVEADTGKIGGSLSHEFMVLADTGEDSVVSCRGCDYAANLEMAAVASPAGESPADAAVERNGSGEKRKDVSTPGQKSVEEVTRFLGITPGKLVKTIVMSGDKGTVGVLVRGDHEVNPVKVRRLVEDETLELAEPEVVEKVTGAPVGFAGPVGLAIPLFADNSVAAMSGFVTGGNAKDVHTTGVDLADFKVEAFADLREAVQGDPCPRCGGELTFLRGIEVGHIFYLGTRYSESMKAHYLDESGDEKVIEMGCYGIGVGRTAAAAIEQNHDDKGIIWPVPIAPFTVALLSLDPGKEEIHSVAEGIYEELIAGGVEVLFDDREERPGVKFNDADLIGLPMRVTVGGRGVKDGVAELKERASGLEEKVPLDKVVNVVMEFIASRS